MKFFCKICEIKWGLILMTVGGGVILAFLLPAEIMVIMLAVILICVGAVLLFSEKKRPFK